MIPQEIIDKFGLIKTDYTYRRTFEQMTWIYKFPKPVQYCEVLISESDSTGRYTPNKFLVAFKAMRCKEDKLKACKITRELIDDMPAEPDVYLKLMADAPSYEQKMNDLIERHVGGFGK